ncbi:MAG: integrase [Sphingobium sp.]|nr:MAG: integrase [Sphingobium sp.]
MSLTMLAIKYAKAKDKAYKLYDEKGLYLLVTPSGGKLWRFRYKVADREKMLCLGRYPTLGLAEARKRQADARKLIADRKDPAIEATRSKLQRKREERASFQVIAEEWLLDNTPRWSQAHASRVRHRLERDLYPAIGKMPVADIDAAMVLAILRKIEGRGSIETAKRVRSYVQAIFKRAKGEKLVERNALHDLEDIKDALKPTPVGQKHPALTTLPKLLDLQLCVDRSTAGAATKIASRLLALTQVRIGVLRTALWEEFEGIDWDDPDEIRDAPIWRIPPERMKLEVDDKLNEAFGHDVPLSTQAVALLRVLRTITGACTLLFPSVRSWREPMSDSAVSTLYKRMAGGRFKNKMVPHGWRSSFSTIMNERAAERDTSGDRMIIDMILAHVPEGMSASEWAYNRARYRKSRARLLQEWADLITKGLPAPDTLRPQDR